ncbi:MAG: nucleoside 2-deoxyribosyltransferase [Alphaproteobacteria bacterium]|nr:nucleoside 2-deoxyribosyltransferase [Alphaproteobacteria bacterium]
MSRKRIYLAGPDVFLRDALEQAARKRALCERYGYDSAFPFDAVLDFTNLSPREKAMRIYHSDVALMDSCDICLAQMTPYRGPSMDVGTAYEMGYMRAQGKLVLGYTNVVGDISARTAAACGGADRLRRRESGAVEDPEGLMIEGMGMVDNLMLDGGIISSGFEIEITDVPHARRYHDLGGFERCLQQLQKQGV